jgi:hypothetical protein
MTREGYQTFQLYLALQRHFTSDYDFFKYNGKVNASSDAYKKRTDVFAFEKLSKIVPSDQTVDFLLAHMLDNPKEYIRNMSKPKYDEYSNRLKKLPQIFSVDLEYLRNEGMSDVMKVTSSDIPIIHKRAISNEISIETIIILDSIFPFVDKHSEECKVPFVFPQYIDKVKNYRPFLLLKVTDKTEIFRSLTKKILLEQ